MTMNIKILIKKYIPQFITSPLRSSIRYFRLSSAFLYDAGLYYKYSMSKKNEARDKLVAKIIMDTHVIEKGLTMPDTRFGFGQERLIILIDNLLTYKKLYSNYEYQVNHGVSVVIEYESFHENHKDKINTQTFKKLSELSEKYNLKEKKPYNKNKQIDTTKSDYFNAISKSFYEFSNSRSSIRSFSDNNIEMEIIEKAIDLSRNTPSACNRQSVRVHVYSSKDDIAKILQLQGGSRGFSHLVDKLLAVTFDTASYFEQNERNTGLVDGGMFCMNLLYSLHFYQVGACILNASHSPDKDKKMRVITKIPANENFVAFISCGDVPDRFRIAKSLRYPTDFIMKIH